MRPQLTGLLLIPLLIATAAPALAADPPVLPVLEGPGVLTATTVVMPVVSTDATATRIRWTRTSAGQAAKTGENAFTSRNQFDRYAELRDTGLQTGRQYDYTVALVTPSGVSGTVAFSAVPTDRPPLTAAPVQLAGGRGSTTISTIAPGSAAGTTTSVAYGDAFDMQVRLATDTAAPAPVSGLGQGRTYELLGRSHDRFGNRTDTVAANLEVPVDDTAARRSAGTASVARSGAYGGTSTVLTRGGAFSSIVTEGRRLQLVGERCPTCGEVDVLVNGIRQARVNTYAPTRQVRQVLWFAAAKRAARTQVLTVQAVGTAGRPAVVVDAFPQLSDATYDAVLTGTSLRLGLDSPLITRDFRPSSQLTLQPDGNLVLRRDGKVLFQTGTRGGVRLTSQADGNIVLYDEANRPLWQTRTGGQGPSTLLLQDDGNLVVRRDTDGAATWTRTSGKRAVPALRVALAGTTPPAGVPLVEPTTSSAPPSDRVLVASVRDELTNTYSLQRIASGSSTALTGRLSNPGSVDVSADGSAYVASYQRAFSSEVAELVVQGVAGGPRVVLDTGTFRSPTISPSGDTVVWRRQTTSSCTVTSSSLQTGRADGTGRATVIASTGNQGFFDPVLLSDDLLLATAGSDDDADLGEFCGLGTPVVTGLVTMRLDGSGGQLVTAPDAASIRSIAVSPAGDRVAFVRVDDLRDPYPGTRIEVAPLTVVNGAATIGTPTVLTPFSRLGDAQPTFSPDGASVLFSSQRAGGYGRPWTVPVTGGGASPLGQPLSDRAVQTFDVVG